MNYKFMVYRNGLPWSRTLTELGARRLVRQLTREGFNATYAVLGGTK